MIGMIDSVFLEIWTMMRSLWIAVFNCGLLANLGATEGAVRAVSLDAMIRHELEACRGDFQTLQSRGEQFQRLGKEHASCDSVLIGYALLLEAHTDRPEGWTRPVLEDSGCSVRGAVLPRMEGVWEFMYGDLDVAREWFYRSLSVEEEEADRANLKQSIGTCFNMESQLDSALYWYDASTEDGLHLLTAISLMNLSNIHLSLGKAEESLEWSLRAEGRVLEELDEGLDPEVFVLRRDLILLNQCLAHVELGNLDDAIATAERMKMKDFLPRMASEFYQFYVSLAWLTDNPDWVERHEAVFSEHLIQDSLAAVERFGVTLCLVEPWKSGCRQSLEGGDVWVRLRNLPKHELPVMLELGRMKEQSQAEKRRQLIGYGLSSLLFVGGVLLLVRLQWLRSQRRKVPIAVRLNQIRESAVLGDGTHGTEALVALAEDYGISGRATSGLNLTSREVEVLFGVHAGERAKETASRMGVGVKSVYMIRTALRKKLGLQDLETLESWLSQRASVKG